MVQKQSGRLHDSATPLMSLPFCKRLNAVDTCSGTAAPASLGRYAATRTVDLRKDLSKHRPPAMQATIAGTAEVVAVTAEAAGDRPMGCRVSVLV